MHEVTAMRMTEVGVETFSFTLERKILQFMATKAEMRPHFYLKSKLRTEKEQISTPEPATVVKMPPTNPVTMRTKACHTPNCWMVSNVLRLYSLFRRNRAKAKLNQTLTNESFFTTGGKTSSITSKPAAI
jgi:hypothetical protein